MSGPEASGLASMASAPSREELKAWWMSGVGLKKLLIGIGIGGDLTRNGAGRGEVGGLGESGRGGRGEGARDLPRGEVGR